MSSNSTIVTPSTPAEESNKRVVGNTSFDEVPSPESGGPSTKRPNTEQSSELPKKLVTEDFLVAKILFLVGLSSQRSLSIVAARVADGQTATGEIPVVAVSDNSHNSHNIYILFDIIK